MSTLRPIVVRAGEGRHSEFPGEAFVSKLGAVDTGGVLAVATGTRAPGAGTPKHRHMKSGEFWFILEGTVTIEIDDEEYTLGAGDIAYAPPGAAHRITNMTDRPVKTLALYTPAGPEATFRKLEELRGSSAGELNPAELIPLLAEMDTHIVGPPRVVGDG